MNIIFIDDDGKVDYEQHGKILNQLYGKIKECKRKDKEIERLNNIINELEEYICAIEYDERNYNETWQIAVRIHNKLQELKGVDKD